MMRSARGRLTPPTACSPPIADLRCVGAIDAVSGLGKSERAQRGWHVAGLFPHCAGGLVGRQVPALGRDRDAGVEDEFQHGGFHGWRFARMPSSTSWAMTSEIIRPAAFDGPMTATGRCDDRFDSPRGGRRAGQRQDRGRARRSGFVRRLSQVKSNCHAAGRSARAGRPVVYWGLSFPGEGPRRVRSAPRGRRGSRLRWRRRRR